MKRISKCIYKWGAIGLGAVLVTATPAAAEPGGETVGLGQVLEVAVRQQPSLAQAAIDVEIANAAVLASAGLDDWVVSASALWSSTRLQALDLDQDTLKLEGNASRALPTGGTVVLHAETGYTQATTALLDNELYDNTITASITHPLLRGRGRRFARASQVQARLSRDAQELGYRAAAISALLEVIDNYWELAYAWRDLEIRQNSLALARERLKNTRLAIDAGSVAPSEALAVEQIIIGREQDIVLAELAISRRSLELRRSAGMEIGPGAVDLVIDAPLAPPAERFVLDALLTRALAQSPTLASLEVLQEGARLEVELAENGMLPELDAALSFGPTGSADTAGKALERMVKFDDLTFSASLTFRQALGQRASKGEVRRRRAQLTRQKLGIADVKAQVAMALVLAVKQAEAAQKRLAASRRAIELAEKNIEAEKSRFQLGRATNFDVLQRQDELKQAQLLEARAIIDTLEAIAAIDAVTGDLLGKYGIRLDFEPGR